MIVLKTVIRIFTAVVFSALCVIFSLVALGSAIVPNNITAFSLGEIVFDDIYTININPRDTVDYQGDMRVSEVDAQVRLFGIIPVKNATVNQQEERQVIVSGECFGIKLYTDGVIVVGTRDVDTAQGKVNPAHDAGLEKGDIIISINDEKMLSSNQVEEALNTNNADAYKVVIKRNGNYKTLSLKPVYSPSEGKYKVGVWVRDSTAGIGTLTFYNPENSSFAALGHPVNDVDTNDVMPFLSGEAVEATVTKLYKSKDGEAGSLCCDFSDNPIGMLTLNSDNGIYGTYINSPDESKAYYVAASQEAERGHAQILCTVDDNPPAFYNVEITRISYNSASGKNIVVKVTDEALLEKTGGIVQGMSGSPIIQNGRLVGALTHVVVDNPAKGYGIFAETMLEESYEVVADSE